MKTIETSCYSAIKIASLDIFHESPYDNNSEGKITSQLNGRNVGYLLYHLNNHYKSVDIELIYVDKDFRERGLGKRLIQEFVNIMKSQHKGLTRVTSDVMSQASLRGLNRVLGEPEYLGDDVHKMTTQEVEKELPPVASEDDKGCLYGPHFSATHKMPSRIPKRKLQPYKPYYTQQNIPFERQASSDVYYHGTTEENARAILSNGIDPSFNRSGMFRGLHLTDKTEFFQYRKYPVMLEVKLDPSKILNVDSITDEDLKEEDPYYKMMSYGWRNNLIEKIAQKRGYYALRNGFEVIVLDNKAVVGIKMIDKVKTASTSLENKLLFW